MTATDLVISCGLGDWVSFDCFWTPEQRASWTTFHYACRPAKLIQTLVQAIPAYAHVKHETLWDFDTDDPGFYCFESRDHLQDHLERDLGQAKVTCFDTVTDFQGSSIVGTSFAEVETPETYAVIHAFTDLDWRHPPERQLMAADWEWVLDWLTKKDMPGIVLGVGDFSVPAHRLLIDLSNKTTLLESVEIARRANAYLGINSWIACLTARSPGLRDFIVKTVDPNLFLPNFRQFYYAPLKTMLVRFGGSMMVKGVIL